jgi:hypothetical protein
MKPIVEIFGFDDYIKFKNRSKKILVQQLLFEKL